MSIDLERFHDLAVARVCEVAKYQKRLCGKVRNLKKAAQPDVAATAVTEAFSYMDAFTQDYLMIPIYEEFPSLVPLVEENTGMKKAFADNIGGDVLFIDPVDGTTVYCDGGSDYSIMLGVVCDGRVAASVTCYPETGEIIGAIRGHGAWRVVAGKRQDLPRIADRQVGKHLAVHYRFLACPPFDEVSRRMKELGYSFSTNIAIEDRQDVEVFGTNLNGVLGVMRGEVAAFVAPHITMHDFAAPSLVVEELGGVMRLFEYGGQSDVTSWHQSCDGFGSLDARGTIPRFRVVIADSEASVGCVVDAIRSCVRASVD